MRVIPKMGTGKNTNAKIHERRLRRRDIDVYNEIFFLKKSKDPYKTSHWMRPFKKKSF